MLRFSVIYTSRSAATSTCRSRGDGIGGGFDSIGLETARGRRTLSIEIADRTRSRFQIENPETAVLVEGDLANCVVEHTTRTRRTDEPSGLGNLSIDFLAGNYPLSERISLG
jgi:hypothetical protein